MAECRKRHRPRLRSLLLTIQLELKVDYPGWPRHSRNPIDRERPLMNHSFTSNPSHINRSRFNSGPPNRRHTHREEPTTPLLLGEFFFRIGFESSFIFVKFFTLQ